MAGWLIGSSVKEVIGSSSALPALPNVSSQGLSDDFLLPNYF